MTPQEMVREFHREFGLAVDAEDTWDLRTFRMNLISEEFSEVQDALMGEEWGDDGEPLSLTEVSKELGDLIYVVYGTAVSMGIDLDEALRRVHLSNMSKRNPDGTVSRDSSGKVLKPAGYQPPDMTGVVK